MQLSKEIVELGLTTDQPEVTSPPCVMGRDDPLPSWTWNCQGQSGDVVPLSNPIRVADGSVVDSVFVSKGTTAQIPIAGFNRSELSGPDAGHGTFHSGRWLVSEGEHGSHVNDKKGRCWGTGTCYHSWGRGCV